MIKVSEIRKLHRNTGGVKLIGIDKGDIDKSEYVVDVAPVGEADEELEVEAEGGPDGGSGD
jgi:hypothetical protein